MNRAALSKLLLRPMSRLVVSSALLLSSVALPRLLVAPVAAADPLPQTCQDIRTQNPSAADGDYTIFPNGLPTLIYCHTMASAPADYLTLPITNTNTATVPTYNYSMLRTGGHWAYEGDLVSRYAKLRIDPLTLVVDRADTTFATSSGSFGSMTTQLYGQAENCNWYSAATANINLTGTPFAVDSSVTFTPDGYYPYGSASVSEDRQSVDMNGGGQCGGIYPRPALKLHYQFASDDTATTNEDAAIVIPVLANDIGSQLTIASATNGARGTTEIDAVAGTISYTPYREERGVDSFTYTARIGNGALASAVVSVVIVPVNDAPLVTVPATQNILVNHALTLSASDTNLALNRDTTQSSVAFDGVSARAVDGNTNGSFDGAGSVTHTDSQDQPWWEVDLGSIQPIGQIRLWNRTDCCSEQLANFDVFVSATPFTSNDPVVLSRQQNIWSMHHAGQVGESIVVGQETSTPLAGRYVRVQLRSNKAILSLAEVEVFGPAPLWAGDVDSGGNVLDVTLAASHGTITLGSTAALAFIDGDGAADPSVTFAGTLTSIAAALDGLTFTPTTDYYGPASITLAVTDQDTTGNGSRQTATATLAINVAQTDQTVSFTTSGSATYGAAPRPLNATASSGLPVNFSVVSGPAVIEGTTLSFTGAGDVVVRATQPGSPSYSAASSEQTVTVAPTQLTVTAADVTRPYGSALPPLSATYSGFVNGDTAERLTDPVQLQTAATATSAVGTYAVTAGGAASVNYTITFVPGTLTVSPAPLTIIAEDQTRQVGMENPPLTARYDGFVNEEGPEVLSTAVQLTTGATTASVVGDYAIVPSAATAANYQIMFVSGTLRVTAVPPFQIRVFLPSILR